MQGCLSCWLGVRREEERRRERRGVARLGLGQTRSVRLLHSTQPEAGLRNARNVSHGCNVSPHILSSHPAQASVYRQECDISEIWVLPSPLTDN